MFSIGMQHF